MNDTSAVQALMEQLISLIDHLTELLDTNQALEAVAYETAHVDVAIKIPYSPMANKALK